jgi:lysophospholipase L1-like esterase
MKTKIIGLASLFFIFFLGYLAFTRFYYPYIIVFDGNSLTADRGTASINYPQQLAEMETIRAKYKNFAKSSQTTVDMIEDASTTVDHLYDPSKKSILVAWEITNDLFFGATPETAYANFVEYCQQRKAVGWRVVVINVLPRSNEGTPTNFEKSRKAVNQKMREDFPDKTNNPTVYRSGEKGGYADFLVDVDSIPELGNPGSEKNTIYYPDLVHLTTYGYTLIANSVKNSINQFP